MSDRHCSYIVSSQQEIIRIASYAYPRNLSGSMYAGIQKPESGFHHCLCIPYIVVVRNSDTIIVSTANDVHYMADYKIIFLLFHIDGLVKVIIF